MSQLGNCHNFILKVRKSQLKCSCKCHVVENFWLKRGGFSTGVLTLDGKIKSGYHLIFIEETQNYYMNTTKFYIILIWTILPNILSYFKCKPTPTRHLKIHQPFSITRINIQLASIFSSFLYCHTHLLSKRRIS